MKLYILPKRDIFGELILSYHTSWETEDVCREGFFAGEGTRKNVYSKMREFVQKGYEIEVLEKERLNKNYQRRLERFLRSLNKND